VHLCFVELQAGLNAITKSLAIDLAKDEILAVVLHPGWVQTEMGGPNALISVTTCVEGLLNVMSKLNAEKSGTFWDYKEDAIPW
jgi:NAD(P)-dependent dehydrogenase (short-subunit alcohol dehydrogenase family)